MSMTSRLEQARQEIRRVILDFLHHEGFFALDEMVRIDSPTERGHGDLTTSFAMKSAAAMKMAPRAVLEKLLAYWPEMPAIESLDIAGPGFLNLTLRTAWLSEVVGDVLSHPEEYGNTDAGRGQRVLLEYVSANPTGPMVLVSGRAAVVGDVLARTMTAAGFSVFREFYVNDAGNQTVTLGHAMALRLKELAGEEVMSAWPENVYPGEYVKDLAARYWQEHPETDPHQLSERHYTELGAYGADIMRQSHEEVLSAFRVTFDQWFSERALREAGAPEKIIDRLRQRGYMREADGALWFTSTVFGDDKDRVMVRSDGTYTYFVPDAAYHAGKFDRGYDYVIDVLGPDHHGYVNRMRAVVEALGYPRDRLEILIIQWVRLMRGKELVRMSKRGGQFVTLEDLIDEAGVDPARFFLAERAPETPLDFDLNLATLKSSDNPVYYVQYAGARIHSIMRAWRASGHQPGPLDFTALIAPSERVLLMLLAEFPDVVNRVALERAPQHLPNFLVDLASAFHSFYRAERILDAPDGVREARLALIEAVLTVITRGLDLLGIQQPEEM